MEESTIGGEILIDEMGMVNTIQAAALMLSKQVISQKTRLAIQTSKINEDETNALGLNYDHGMTGYA